MTRDKQLLQIDRAHVLEKRRLDQALNTKEFAVVAGISYSTARDWFRQPGFPAFRGYVFWQDFVAWRTAKSEMMVAEKPTAQQQSIGGPEKFMHYSPRVVKILNDAGVHGD